MDCLDFDVTLGFGLYVSIHTYIHDIHSIQNELMNSAYCLQTISCISFVQVAFRCCCA